VKVDGLDTQSQNKIRTEMQKLGNVESVEANQETGLVKIKLRTERKVSNNQVMQAIKQAGYKPREIVKSPIEISELEKPIPQRN